MTYSRRQSEETVNREAMILQAMAKATLEEQEVLAAELDELRRGRRRAKQADRDIDLANAVIRDTLTPVIPYQKHSSQTDWIGKESDYEYHNEMKSEATIWFGKVSAEVKADRDEFAEQAQGVARRVSGKFGLQAEAAKRAFLDTVAFLWKQSVKTATRPTDGQNKASLTIDKDWEWVKGRESTKKVSGVDAASEDNWECDEPGCTNMVFSEEEVAAGVPGTIAPDFCAIHELDESGNIRQSRRSSKRRVAFGGEQARALKAELKELLKNKTGAKQGGVYDDSRWQWIDGNYGPMGWFSDAEKQGFENDPDFANGHWQEVTQDERDSMNRWYTDLASQQANKKRANDSPGQVDEDQSGNAESQVTDYDTETDQPPMFSEDWGGEDDTGSEIGSGVHPEMPIASVREAKTALDPHGTFSKNEMIEDLISGVYGLSDEQLPDGTLIWYRALGGVKLTPEWITGGTPQILPYDSGERILTPGLASKTAYTPYEGGPGDPSKYKSRAAQEAAEMGYGGPDYWAYMDESAQSMHDYFMGKGQPDIAAEMFTRSLGEALAGNDGI